MERLIKALLLYVELDECVCDYCTTPDCQGCMYCIAHSALVAIGYFADTDTPASD